jgi:hypothetical protein
MVRTASAVSICTSGVVSSWKQSSRGRRVARIPRFGSTKEKLTLIGGAMNEPAAAASGPKPSFPTSELEQTAAVLSVLNAVTEPASATALAVRFRQGRRVLPQVEAVLAALIRVGGLVTSPDGGRSFLPRRAA